MGSRFIIKSILSMLLCMSVITACGDDASLLGIIDQLNAKVAELEKNLPDDRVRLTEEDVKKSGTVPFNCKEFNVDLDLAKGDEAFKCLKASGTSDCFVARKTSPDPFDISFLASGAAYKACYKIAGKLSAGEVSTRETKIRNY